MHVLPWGNYMIAGWGNYVIVNPSHWGNNLIADRQRPSRTSAADPSTHRPSTYSQLTELHLPIRQAASGNTKGITALSDRG